MSATASSERRRDRGAALGAALIAVVVVWALSLTAPARLDKYIGDAIMACWGAPLADDAHPEHAVRAVLRELPDDPAALRLLERLASARSAAVGTGWSCALALEKL